jgi:hypothetical protein
VENSEKTRVPDTFSDGGGFYVTYNPSPPYRNKTKTQFEEEKNHDSNRDNNHTG